MIRGEEKNQKDSYQANLDRRRLVGGVAAFQLLQGFALVRDGRMIVLMQSCRVPVVAAGEAGVRAPVGQAVSSPEVVDGEGRAGGEVKIREFPHILVVLGR